MQRRLERAGDRPGDRGHRQRVAACGGLPSSRRSRQSTGRSGQRHRAHRAREGAVPAGETQRPERPPVVSLAAVAGCFPDRRASARKPRVFVNGL